MTFLIIIGVIIFIAFIYVNFKPSDFKEAGNDVDVMRKYGLSISEQNLLMNKYGRGNITEEIVIHYINERTKAL